MSKANKEAVDMFFDSDIDFVNRTLFCWTQQSHIEHGPSGTDDGMAEHVIKGLHLLEHAKVRGGDPITILMLNRGGDFHAGMSIYAAMVSSPCHITMKVYGAAFSMGSVILQGAKTRIMMPESSLMIHRTSESVSEVSPETMLAWGKDAIESMERIYNIYARRSGKISKYWKERCANDFILSAEKTVEEGLADQVWKVKK